MNNIDLLPNENLGKNFIPPDNLPAGKDEYYFRNEQLGLSPDHWRHLRPDEIERLKLNNNTADNWENVLVSKEFDPGLIRNSAFFGLVRIGALRENVLAYQGMRMPAGITNSRIVSCDIGDDAAVHDVRYLAQYIIGNRCLLTSIGAMYTTDCAKFGNGILKDGEDEEARIWMEIMNECGGRKVLAFSGMIPADAFLWAKFRDDVALQKKLEEITGKKGDSRRGLYGTIGEQCAVVRCGTIKNVAVGSHAALCGAAAITDVTINSSAGEPTSIGEGVELAHGIVGRGCTVLSGARAERFVLCDHTNLKYNAVLLDSVVGENSTLSCCEVRNSLVFPAHEQHHNGSLLIASLVMGQSNVAAGATIGSNHNSRANDLEVEAGRGFWPGLCTSVKHSSRFASFTLLAKADYPYELDVTLPFSLVNNNAREDRLEVVPAFWWLHNMYALARNASKFVGRDKRKTKSQHIEFEALAPDTAEEILRARRLLEIWTAKAVLREKDGKIDERKEDGLLRMGRELLSKKEKLVRTLEVRGDGMEKSRRSTAIMNVVEGYNAYGDMLHYYAVKNCLEYLQKNGQQNFASLCKALKGAPERGWTNLGGQLVPTREVDRLRADIGLGKLDTWDNIHAHYDQLSMAYPIEKQRHAFAVLCGLLETTAPTKKHWLQALDRVVKIQEYIYDQVYASRKKDDDNPFRRATFRNANEMKAAVGTVDENSFVKNVRKETDEFIRAVGKARIQG
jgi:hypothetical protein